MSSAALYKSNYGGQKCLSVSKVDELKNIVFLLV